MLRRQIRAFAALSASLVMCLSAPVLSLLHGQAHHELAEHSVERHHSVAAEMSVSGAESQYTTARLHGHPVVDPGLLPRIVPLFPALVPSQATVDDFDVLRFGTSPVPPVSSDTPPDPVATRRQQPRAPPTL